MGFGVWNEPVHGFQCAQEFHGVFDVVDPSNGADEEAVVAATRLDPLVNLLQAQQT